MARRRSDEDFHLEPCGLCGYIPRDDPRVQSHLHKHAVQTTDGSELT